MSINNQAAIQSVTISGITVTTLSGVVKKGSKAELGLKAIREQCEKDEVIKRASRIATVLIDEHENRTYRPNIDYLCSCLVNRDTMWIMNWLLSVALAVIRPTIDCPHILYSTSGAFLDLLEDIVNGHS